MIRKLRVILLSGLICLLGVTSALAVEYKEAPMLRVKVAAGELPPVEQRLPEEPFVVEPKEIGQHGGELRLLAFSATSWYPASQFGTESLFILNRSCTELIPDIAKGWEYSKDRKTFTIYLRKGLKWSDGAPFTADDILFWWEDVVLNPQITPAISKGWMPGGKLMEVEKVDDYQVRLRFAVPFNALDYIGGVVWRAPQEYLFLPKHTLKKYHIKYNPKANELAKKEGYENWAQLFTEKMTCTLSYQPPEIPTLNAWVTKKVTPNIIIWERNPYYFKVDTAGNQLPYIDKKIGLIIPTKEVQILKLMSGEIDVETQTITMADYPLLKQSEKKGNYHVWLVKGTIGSSVGLYINQTYEEDPVIGKILRDVRVRRALSLAINREEILNVVYYGQGVPRQIVPNPDCTFYEEEWGKAYTEYDPERANKLLDEVGLKWDKNHEWRLRPDGKILTIVISLAPKHREDGPVCELIKEYWEKVGVKTLLNSVSKGYLWTMDAAGTHQVWVMTGNETTQLSIYKYGFGLKYRGWPGKWRTWWQTEGESGEEPPEEVKEFFSLCDKLTVTGGEEREQIAKKAFRIWSENLWTLGIVGLLPSPILAKNDLGNVDEKTPAPDPAYGAARVLWIEEWFWKQ